MLCRTDASKKNKQERFKTEFKSIYRETEKETDLSDGQTSGKMLACYTISYTANFVVRQHVFGKRLCNFHLPSPPTLPFHWYTARGQNIKYH